MTVMMSRRATRVVWKFGGTSVGTPQRIRSLARRLVRARQEGTEVVAVLSAMGGTTDTLLGQARAMSDRPPARELDALLSVGEMVSCSLTAIAVNELGERAVSLTGAQAGVRTDATYGAAQLLRVNPARILRELSSGAIVLVSGFQGVTERGDVTTLGRGGSDASAIAIAAALGLSECDIYTDVPGVFDADPNVVPDARMFEWLPHDEMLRMAEAGAKVLQPRAVELAAAYGVDIHVRSSFTDHAGTWVGYTDRRTDSTWEA